MDSIASRFRVRPLAGRTLPWILSFALVGLPAAAEEEDPGAAAPAAGAAAPMAAPPAAGTAPMAKEATPATATAASEPAPGRVSRAAFTTAVQDREPVGEVTSLTEDVGEILFFSELVDLEGQTVVHRWEYEGQVMAEVPIAVGGPRWRVHSSKRLLPGWTGEWTVTVLDESGTALHSGSFVYDPVAAIQPTAQERTGETPAAPLPASRAE